MDYDYQMKSREKSTKKTHTLSSALLGIWVCTLFAFAPASGTDTTKSTDEKIQRSQKNAQLGLNRVTPPQSQATLGKNSKTMQILPNGNSLDIQPKNCTIALTK
jgi:hypothetical protein